MGRTYAYQKLSSTIYFTYKCSKCGMENHGRKTIKTTGSSSQYGSPWTQKSMNKLKDAAHENAVFSHDYTIMQIFLEANQKKYKTAHLRWRCIACDRMEPWARYDVQWLETACIYIGVIGLFVAFFIGSILKSLLTIAITALLITLIYLWVNYRCKSIENDIAALPQSALPVFSFKDEYTKYE